MTAAEIVAKLSIQGLPEWKQGMDHASTAVEKLGRAAGGIGDLFKNMMGFAGGQLLANAIQSIGSGLVGFVSQSITAANAAEEFQMALMGMGNSAEVVKGKMDFINKLAVPSTFTAAQLRESALMLEGMGIRAERALPAIAKIAMGTGRGTREDLMMLGSMFGRMGTGQAPELEALSHFGITQKQLASFGAIQGNAKSMLDAIEKMANDKFGSIFETMANTGSAKLSSLQDMWQQFMEKTGGALMNWLGPTLDRLGQWGRYLFDSGWLDKLTGQLSALGSGDGSWLDRPVAMLLALAENLPSMFEAAGKVLANAFEYVQKTMQQAFMPIMSGSMSEMLTMAWVKATPAIMFASRDESGVHRKQRRLEELQGQSVVKEAAYMLDNPINAYQSLTMPAANAIEKVSARTDEILASMAAFRASGGLPTDPDPSAGWGKAVADSMTQPLDAIAKHTASMDSNLQAWTKDLKRFVIGGASAAEMGLSPVDIGRMRPGNGPIPMRIDAGGQRLNMAIEEIVQRAVAQMARQGYMQITVR